MKDSFVSVYDPTANGFQVTAQHGNETFFDIEVKGRKCEFCIPSDTTIKISIRSLTGEELRNVAVCVPPRTCVTLNATRQVAPTTVIRLFDKNYGLPISGVLVFVNKGTP